MNGLSPVCERTCSCNLAFRLNVFEQPSYGHGIVLRSEGRGVRVRGGVVDGVSVSWSSTSASLSLSGSDMSKSRTWSNSSSECASIVLQFEPRGLHVRRIAGVAKLWVDSYVPDFNGRFLKRSTTTCKVLPCHQILNRDFGMDNGRNLADEVKLWGKNRQETSCKARCWGHRIALTLIGS